MKKILLLLTAILLALPSSIFAQSPIIDTIFVSQPISCFGQTGGIQINVDQTTPATPVCYVVGRYQDNTTTPDSTSFWLPSIGTAQTTGSPQTLLGLPSNVGVENINYFVRIVDSLFYYNTHPSGFGPGNDGVLGQSTSIFLSQPNQLSSSLSVLDSNLCFGDCVASQVLEITGGSKPYNYIFDSNPLVNLNLNQSTDTLNSLCGGTYPITVSDINGCSDNASSNSVSVNSPTQITTLISKTNVFCFGGNNGQAFVNASGGSPSSLGYTYLWDTSPSQTTATAENLTQGIYFCTISDGECSVVTPPTFISEPQQLTSSITSTIPLTCPNSSNGNAVVTPSGGTPFAGGIFLYSWNTIPEQNDSIAVNLSQGIYSCTISQANGCDPITRTITISPPSNSITIDTIIITPATCAGNDTQLEIFASGGQIPYSFSINGGFSSQSTSSFGPLADDTLSIRVTDDNACFFEETLQISSSLLEIDSTYFSDPSCNGANDAEILSIDVVGGTPPYQYSVNGSVQYANLSNFNGYGPGLYTVEVYDSENCVGADYIIIENPDVLVANITTSGWVFNSNSGLYSYQIQCYGDSSGFADFSISGGSPPYEILCVESSGDTIHNSNLQYIDNLQAGTYTFTVIDANGCTNSQTIAYKEPDQIMHNFIANHVTCNGSNNGSLLDSIYGGVGNASTYIYSWNTGASTYNITGLTVGTYTMTVTDDNNCSSNQSYSINASNALVASVSMYIDVSCYDFCDGEILISASGGTPNYDINGDTIYNYQWNDILAQTSSNAVGLCVDNILGASEYSCTISDGQGCFVNVTQMISQPDLLSVSATITSNYNFEDISCYGASDGKIKAQAFGGNSPYEFVWSTGFTSNGPTSSNITNLNSGTYTVVVEDTKGCMDTTEIILNEPAELYFANLSDTSVTCFGLEDGKIVAIADSGTAFFGIPPEYLYSVIDQTGNTVYSIQDSFLLAENLSPGIYTVNTTDKNGCSIISSSIFIAEPSDFLTIELSSADESCNSNNGSVISNVDGGSAPYTYMWSNGSSASFINNLSPSVYFVEVIDLNGCIVSDTIRVNGSEEIFMPGNISSFDTTICLGKTFELNIDEKELFTYVWKNGNDTLLNQTIYNISNDNADISVTPNNYNNIYTLSINDPSCVSYYEVIASINVDFIDPILSSNPVNDYGNYPVILSGETVELYSQNSSVVEYSWSWNNDTISNNSGLITINNLQQSDWYYLHVKDSEGCLGYDSIYVVVGVLPYDAITPNNDGLNDFWTPKDIKSYDDALVQVFNRWGSLVFESRGGENYIAWDGTNSGEQLNVGTYYYIIDLNTGDSPQSGPVTIIR